MTSSPDFARYIRQTSLPELGERGQLLLSQARVLLVGAGGLGCPIAQYLVAAGIGNLGLIDPDTVSTDNLPRQILYIEEDVGKPKVECAARRLRAMNGQCHIDTYARCLDEGNAEELIGRYDMVVDGCDNYATRYLIDRVTARQHKPYIYAAITGFTGQVAVFHAAPDSPSYRDLFPEPPETPPDKRVIGMTAGIIGCVATHEAVKIIGRYSPTLSRRLWTIDLLTMQTQTFGL